MCPVMKGGCMVAFKTMVTARIFAVICGRPQNSERPQQTNKLRCGEMSKRKGKIVYTPPERCYTNVNIEETPHGYAVYRQGADRPFTLIPTSAVKQIEYKEE